MFSKQNIVYALMALIIIGAFGYMAYGEDEKQTKIQELESQLATIAKELELLKK